MVRICQLDYRIPDLSRRLGDLLTGWMMAIAWLKQVGFMKWQLAQLFLEPRLCTKKSSLSAEPKKNFEGAL